MKDTSKPSYILYRLIKYTCFIIFKIFFAFRIEGKENVPKNCSFIVACNHVSYLDPVVLGTALPVVLHFMAKEELFSNRFFGAFLKGIATFPVKRGYQDFKAIKEALKLLKYGEVIAIFPEGGRVENSDLGQSEPGIGMLAAHSGVGVLPVFIKGTGGVLSKKSRFAGFKPIGVYIGKILKFDRFKDIQDKKQAYREFSNEVMRSISSLKESHEA